MVIMTFEESTEETMKKDERIFVTEDEAYTIGERTAHSVVVVVIKNKLRVIKNKYGPRTDDLLGDYNRLAAIAVKCEQAARETCNSSTRSAYRKVLKWIKDNNGGATE